MTCTSRLAACLTVLVTGCWWQKDGYTDRQQQAMDSWGREQEWASVLGDPYVDMDLGLFIRPPKPAVPVQKPEALLALFHGGDPPLEVVILGDPQSKAGSLPEF